MSSWRMQVEVPADTSETILGVSTALVFLTGVGFGAQIAGTAVLLHEIGALSIGGIALTLVGGAAVGGLLALVLWDLARQRRRPTEA